jgi:hypothetical protein
MGGVIELMISSKSFCAFSAFFCSGGRDNWATSINPVLSSVGSPGFSGSVV